MDCENILSDSNLTISLQDDISLGFSSKAVEILI
jgi:hypothetical protein